jgi:hypothetical protein
MTPLNVRQSGSCTLATGTKLFRVHKRHRRPTSFNTSQAWANERDGRFDSDADDYYPFYYAALSERGALYETLVVEAGLAVGDPVPHLALKDRVLSVVELARDVILVSLRTEADFALTGQSEWLVRALPREYPLTRRQARSIRSRHSRLQGLIWYSRKDPEEQSVILFGDRCPVGTLRETTIPSIALDTPSAEPWLGRLLAAYPVA